MATVNYYLDKEDKNGCSRIYIRIQSKGKQTKLSTGAKVPVRDFDKKRQRVVESNDQHESINYYLNYLKDRAKELINESVQKGLTKKEIKENLREFISAYKKENDF